MPPSNSSLPRAILSVATLAVGFASGYLIHSTSPNSEAPAEAAPDKAARSSSSSGHEDETRPFTKNSGNSIPSDLRSYDSLDDLMALNEDDLFPRLALWLVDAGPADYEDCWHALSEKTTPNTRMLDMLFIRWTSDDPIAAIQAAEGTSFSHIPWWGWSKNDPTAAYEYACEHQPDQLGQILYGIGQREPEMAMRLLQMNPDAGKNGLPVRGIIEGLTNTDPEAAVKFSFENQSYLDSKPLEAWLREDPVAALKWIFEKQTAIRGINTVETLKTLERENPDQLPQLADSLPHGNLRRQVESMIFQQLIRSDPEKAMEQARANPSKKIAAQQLAQIAESNLKDDPARSLEIFTEMLEDKVDAISSKKIEYQDGASSEGGGGEMASLIQGLIQTDPEGTLNAALSVQGDAYTQTTYNMLYQWGTTDSTALAEWAIHVDSPSIQKSALEVVYSKYKGQGDLGAFIPTIEQIAGKNRQSIMRQFISGWYSDNPDAASAWFSQANLSAEDREALSPTFQTSNR
ncbi:hypothetical protein JIN85_09010 [Luteolibacter pohnpeiensis]|uniref:Uncharacterized protein n=1 Tax=Luteolibacter pohnpeiensis TaxID=454153 RepID=A0A934S7B8_9BACT|nr:hypothetical protein [Luteolibacter pohnpeiensis]MBK1882554.1 hypothetical protein [Luteolibacter pohnpeiensis]